MSASPRVQGLTVALDLIHFDDDPQSVDMLCDQRDEALRIAAEAIDECRRLEATIEAVLVHAERYPWTGLADRPEILDVLNLRRTPMGGVVRVTA